MYASVQISTLVQIMACRLDGAKPSSEPMAPSHHLNQCWNIVNWTLRNKLRWNFSRNSNIFFQKNAHENVVCVIASISSRPQWVNSLWPIYAQQYQELWASLVQIMAYHLFITKAITCAGPMCHFDHQEQKWVKCSNFLVRKLFWKCHLQYVNYFAWDSMCLWQCKDTTWLFP